MITFQSPKKKRVATTHHQTTWLVAAAGGGAVKTFGFPPPSQFQPTYFSRLRGFRGGGSTRAPTASLATPARSSPPNAPSWWGSAICVPPVSQLFAGREGLIFCNHPAASNVCRGWRGSQLPPLSSRPTRAGNNSNKPNAILAREKSPPAAPAYICKGNVSIQLLTGWKIVCSGGVPLVERQIVD